MYWLWLPLQHRSSWISCRSTLTLPIGEYFSGLLGGLLFRFRLVGSRDGSSAWEPTGSSPYKNRLHFVQTPLFHHDNRFYAFLIWISKVGSNVALFPCLLLVERRFRRFQRNFYNTTENIQNLSHSILITRVFMYGSERFKEIFFDKGFRLVYLVIAFAKDCSHRPFSNRQGLCCVLPGGPHASLSCTYSPIVSCKCTIISTLDRNRLIRKGNICLWWRGKRKKKARSWLKHMIMGDEECSWKFKSCINRRRESGSQAVSGWLSHDLSLFAVHSVGAART
jgi:hypothetical protein